MNVTDDIAFYSKGDPDWRQKRQIRIREWNREQRNELNRFISRGRFPGRGGRR